MIIVNYFKDENYNKDTDGYELTLAAIVNDTLDLNYDIELIKDCIDNSFDFNPENGVMYELQLNRATIQADPIDENAFCIATIIKKSYNLNEGWITPLVRL